MITRTSSQNIDFQNLVKQLDSVLAILDGEEHAFFLQFNRIETLKNIVVYYSENQAVGCGALKEIDSETAEVKRMFVSPNFRNKEIATKILTELETWAKELNYKHLILETGTNNPSAISLYLKNGYKITENYGQYFGVKSSCCFGKNI